MLTFQAVYRKGVLKPQQKLNLPENAVVQVQIISPAAKAGTSASLFGAVPELASITDNDLAWARGQLDEGVQR